VLTDQGRALEFLVGRFRLAVEGMADGRDGGEDLPDQLDYPLLGHGGHPSLVFSRLLKNCAFGFYAALLSF
jgi:hypothetical protein